MITARYGIPKVEVASFESQALRDAARDAPCMFRTPWCNGNSATVVLIHSDLLSSGNGWGTKGHDADAAAGCSDCHRWFGEAKQGTAEERERVFITAHRRWWRWLLETGRARIGPPAVREKVSKLTRPSKIVPRRGYA